MARSGSMVFLKYEDRTLPLNYSTKTLDIIANATVIDLSEPYEVIPEDEKIDVNRAEKLIDFGNYLGLISYTSEILRQNPHDVDALFYQGVCFFGNSGDVIMLSPRALENFDKVLEINPEYLGAWYYKSKVLYQMKNYDEALIFIDKALAIYPNFQDAIIQKELILTAKNEQANQPPIPTKAAQLTKQGTLLAQIGDYQGALRLIDQALELEPDNVNALNDKGWIFLQAENPTEALVWINKTLEIDPNLVHALHNKGLALFELEQFEESMIWFDRALEDPSYEDEIGDKVSMLNDLGRKLAESGKIS